MKIRLCPLRIGRREWGAGLAAAACVAAGLSPARAEPTDPVGLLVNIPVETPTRGRTSVLHSPTTVQVISRQDLQDAGIRTVAEALGRLVGDVQYVQGSVGAFYSIRGYSSSSNFNERELILLDGQPLNDADIGTFDLNTIPTNNVDHIEVVAGPGSALYGPDAFAGVINIITRRPGQIDQDMAEVYAGDRVFAGGGVVAGHSARPSGATTDPASTPGWSISGLYNRDPGLSSVANNNFETASVRAQLVLPGSLQISAGQFNSDSGSPGYAFNSPPTPHDRLRMDLTTAMVNWTPLHGRHETQVKAYAEAGSEEARSEQPVGSGMFSFLDTTAATYGVEAQSRLSQGNGSSLLVGADLRRFTSSGGISADASNLAAFAQEELHLGRFSPSIGLRYDYQSIYGSRVNPRLAATYELSSRFYLRGSLGTAYRAPSFLELFIPGYVINQVAPVPGGVLPVIVHSNSGLKPEDTTASELGIRGELGGGVVLDAAIFDDQVDNLITFVVNPPQQLAPTMLTGTWANTGSQAIRGAEISLARSLGNHAHTSLQYVYLDANHLTLNNPAALAPPGVAPRHQLVWQTYADHLRGFNAALIVDARSGSPDRGGALDTDLTVGHSLGSRVGAQIIAHNLFDNGYEVGQALPGSGRAVLVRLTGTF